MGKSTQPSKARLQQLAADLGLDTKGSKADLAARIDEHQQAQEATGPRTMAQHLRSYRARYQPSRSASGNASMHNGDDLASLLAGSDPTTIAKAVGAMLDEDLVARYGHLNPGQIRMNAGNKARAAIKRGEATVEDVAKALAKVA